MEYPMICPACDSPKERCVISEDGLYRILSDKVTISSRGPGTVDFMCMACGAQSSYVAWLTKSSGKEADEADDETGIQSP